MLWVIAGCSCNVLATRHGGSGMCCIGLMVLLFIASALLVPKDVCCMSGRLSFLICRLIDRFIGLEREHSLVLIGQEGRKFTHARNHQG